MNNWQLLLLGGAIVVVSLLGSLLTYDRLDNRLENEFIQVRSELEQLRRDQVIASSRALPTVTAVEHETAIQEENTGSEAESTVQDEADNSQMAVSESLEEQPTATPPTEDICYRSISVQEELLQKHSTQFCSAVDVRELFRLRELTVSLDDRGRLQRSDFANMPNLIAMELDNIPIATVSSDLLLDLTGLERLDLEIRMDHGHLIRSDLLAGLPVNLKQLRLYFRIDGIEDSPVWQEHLPSDLFSAVPALQYLELGFDGYGHSCLSLHDDSLLGLTALKELRIEGSSIGPLGRAAFSDLKSLGYLYVSDRPCGRDDESGSYVQLDQPHEVYLPDVDTLLRIQECCSNSYPYEVKGVTTP